MSNSSAQQGSDLVTGRWVTRGMPSAPWTIDLQLNVNTLTRAVGQLANGRPSPYEAPTYFPGATKVSDAVLVPLDGGQAAVSFRLFAMPEYLAVPS